MNCSDLDIYLVNSEWKQLKSELNSKFYKVFTESNFSDQKKLDLIHEWMLQNKYLFPNIIFMYKLYLTLILSNACVERCFSSYALIHSDKRNKLN